MNDFIAYIELNDSCEMGILELKNHFNENKTIPESLVSSLISFYKKSHNKIRLPLYNAIERDLSFECNYDMINIFNNLQDIIFNICNKNELKHSDKGVEFFNSCASFESAVIYNMFYSKMNIDWRYVKTNDKMLACARSLYDKGVIPLMVCNEWALYDMMTYDLICKIDSLTD